MSKHQTTEFDLARDELLSHIHRCGVLKATSEQQAEWMKDTIGYMGERFPELSDADLAQLEEIGTRFCQPVIPHGKGHTALTPAVEEDEGSDGAMDEPELAGAV